MSSVYHGAGSKVYQVGDFINYDNVQCVISSIVEFGPYNPADYYLCNLDNGNTFKVKLWDIHRHHRNLPQVDVNVIDWEDDNFVEFSSSGKVINECNVATFDLGDVLGLGSSSEDTKENILPTEPPSRFKDLSGSQLDSIAEANEEPETKKQTKWAVKLLKGTFTLVF